MPAAHIFLDSGGHGVIAAGVAAMVITSIVGQILSLAAEGVSSFLGFYFDQTTTLKIGIACHFCSLGSWKIASVIHSVKPLSMCFFFSNKPTSPSKFLRVQERHDYSLSPQSPFQKSTRQIFDALLMPFLMSLLWVKQPNLLTLYQWHQSEAHI